MNKSKSILSARAPKKTKKKKKNKKNKKKIQNYTLQDEVENKIYAQLNDESVDSKSL